MTVWFTSDWHLDHHNIIVYCTRPFENKTKMNNTILRHYRDMVADEDEVYFIGDLSLRGPDNFNWYKNIFSKLPGTKHLILGNHDRLSPWQYEDAGFMTVHTALHLELLDLYLVHDPAKTLVRRDKLWICGHVHNLFGQMIRRNVVNVCVDVWKFKPVSLEQILAVSKEAGC